MSYWSSKDQVFVLDGFIDGKPVIGYRVPDGNTVAFRLDAAGHVIDDSVLQNVPPHVAGVEFFAASTR